MLKLGVTTRAGVRRPRTLLGRRRYVSLLLLRDLAVDPETTDDEYDRLVGHACMPNGVWKLTGHGRLRILDDAILDVLRNRYGSGERLDVCDLAASTGATSLDLFRALKPHFDVRFTASDLYRDAIAVRDRRRGVAIVFDGAGNEIQYVWGRFVLPHAPAESAMYPVNRTLKALLGRRFVPAARAAMARVAVDRLGQFESVVVDGYEILKLPILTRDALAAVAARDGFTFETWNILDPLPQRTHVIRAMNILTPEHFSDDLRRRAIQHCVDAVLPQGLFVIGSSPTHDPETVQASIYLVDAGGLVRLAAVNGGSEVDAVVATVCRVVEPERRSRRA